MALLPLPGFLRKPLGQGIAVAVTGLLIGLVANALSPRGLSLGRDYFPKAENPSSGQVDHLGQIRSKGYRPMALGEAADIFRSPDYAREIAVFVDVRRDDLYQQGHVPGAWQLDRFHPELHLGSVLPVCRTARQVVVYCGGGDCEDSLFGADLLVDAGIPKDRLLILPGGIREWEAAKLPVETGPRLSGAFKPLPTP